MTDRELVLAWEAGDTAAEIGAEHGLSPDAVHARVKRLRARGVALRPHKPGRRRKDVDALKRLVGGDR